LKQIYTIGIIILLAAGFYGVQFHRDYVEPAPDKALRKTPTKPTISASPRRSSTPQAIAPIWERSLFALYRGESEQATAPEAPAAPKNKAVMELIGVCKFGSFSGATILDKTPVRRVAGQPAKKSGAVFYRLGDTLDSGYVLKKVTRNTATLARGSSELIIELDFGGTGSAKRNSAEVTNQKKVIAEEAKRLAGENTTAPEAEEKPKKEQKPKSPLPKNPPKPSLNRGELNSITREQQKQYIEQIKANLLNKIGKRLGKARVK